jgi:hypothetical protein
MMPMTPSSIASATTQYLDHRSSAYNTRAISGDPPYETQGEVLKTYLSDDADLLIHHLPLLFPLHQILHRYLSCIFILLECIIGLQVDPQDRHPQHPQERAEEAPAEEGFRECVRFGGALSGVFG